MNCIQTNAGNPDFKALVQLLDKELAMRDGEEHAFYHQFNHINTLNHCIVLYKNSKAVGCGALKVYDTINIEIKRMYVIDSERGKGLASEILRNLELWAKELGYQKCILETGIRQPEAIALYKKMGYSQMSNYGQYIGITNSVCFEKFL